MRDEAAWPRWLEEAQNSPLTSFARRLNLDRDAVDAALRLPWSNGMVSHIQRPKLLKRQMYGRAGFDLLRLRVLHSPDLLEHAYSIATSRVRFTKNSPEPSYRSKLQSKGWSYHPLLADTALPGDRSPQFKAASFGGAIRNGSSKL
jgi:hypothetical protein